METTGSPVPVVGADAPSRPSPFYEADGVTLYHGDAREILPLLGLEADLVVMDPPYGGTALSWDRWPEGILEAVTASVAPAASLWLWLPEGEMLERYASVTSQGWRFRQTQCWRKTNGTGAADGRLLKVHEIVWHFTVGRWGDLETSPPRTVAPDAKDRSVRRMNPDAAHRRSGRAHAYVDDGTRLARSVVDAPSVRNRGRNETEKPEAVIWPLVKGYCAPDGLVLDPTVGSGTTLDVARACGIRAVGIDVREDQCEKVAERLAQTIIR